MESPTDEEHSYTSLNEVGGLKCAQRTRTKRSSKRRDIEENGYRSDESDLSDDEYNVDNQSQFTEKTPTSVLDWLQPGIQKPNRNKRRNEMKENYMEKNKLLTRKQNEAIHRAMKMSPDKCLLHEDKGADRGKRAPGLFDDISNGSIGSAASSAYTIEKPSVTNSLMAHLLQMNKEKQQELNDDEVKSSTGVSNKAYKGMRDADEEMLQQLLACKTPSASSKQDEERLTQFEVLTPCFLAFGLISIILFLILFLIPWKHQGLPPVLPEMPSPFPSSIPSLQPISSHFGIDYSQQIQDT